MKKTIMLFFGMILLLNGADLKSSENNESNRGGEYLYKISKKVSLEKDGTEEYLFTDTEVFNNKGQLIQDKRESKDFTWLTYYTYNSDGKKIKELSKDLAKPEDEITTLYHYDNEGVLKERTELDIHGTVQSRREIYKDDDNNTKKEYNKDGKLIKEVEDTKWALISIRKIGENKDAPDKPIKRTEYYGKRITTYSYDKVGNEIKQEFVDRYEHIDKTLYRYDNKGNLLSENNTSEQNNTIVEHYIIFKEYDGHNNLTKEYTKVFKSVSACRGGLTYHTPNHELVFMYDKENRVVKLESTMRSSYGEKVFLRKYRTDIHYEYEDELRF